MTVIVLKIIANSRIQESREGGTRSIHRYPENRLELLLPLCVHRHLSTIAIQLFSSYFEALVQLVRNEQQGYTAK